MTSSNGTAFPVQDSVNFASAQVSEVFADGFTQSLSLQDAYGDPVGTMVFPGFSPAKTLSLTVQTDAAGDTAQQSVFTPFSASLFGPASSGVAIGTFSLLNLGSGLGALAVSRRRAAR